MTNTRTFGSWLRECRKARDLTQERLADLVGCSAETIRKFEAERLRPSLTMAERLALKLDVAPDEQPLFLHLARHPSRPALTHQASTNLTTAPVTNLTMNVLAPITPLVGREEALAAITAYLHQADVRLLTLLGTGGVGKTRLALAAAAAATSLFGHVYVVSLAAIHDPDLVIPTIAQALGVRESGNQTAWQALANALQETATLLVLDNVEQILPAMPALADLLSTCPRLKLMVTSRTALRLRGEHELLVPPLTLPAAMTLLVQRVRAVQPTFALSTANEGEIAAICTRLDKLPLALELAAPRMKLLAPSALLARLDGAIFTPLDVLASGARDLPVRQQSLRATIAWSFELLDAAEQRLFARLAVFVGGWTLEAAEAICGTGTGEVVRLPQPVLDEIEALIDGSLLVRQDAGTTVRFAMLERIREYAREQLVANNECAAIEQRHGSYYAALAQQAVPELRGPQQPLWMARIEAEQPNLRAALVWALAAADTDPARSVVALQLASTLGAFWVRRGQLSEARRWLEQALARSSTVPSAARAGALVAASIPAMQQGDYSAARAWLDESIAISRALGDTHAEITALTTLAALNYYQGDLAQVQASCTQSLALLGTERSLLRADALRLLANSIELQGEYARAGAYYAESLAVYRAGGDAHGTNIALANLGLLAYSRGHYAEAEAYCTESLAWHRAQGDTQRVAVLLFNLGAIVCQRQDLRRATALYQESLVLRRRLGDQRGIGLTITGLGEVARAQGDYKGAITLFNESLSSFRQLNNRTLIAMLLTHLGLAHFQRDDDRLAADCFRESLTLQRALDSTDMLPDALVGVAGLAVQRGDFLGAAQLAAATEHLLALADAQLEYINRALYERTLTAVRAQLDPGAFARAWADGTALAVSEIFTTALAFV